jgi:anti-sigma factor RsiW
MSDCNENVRLDAYHDGELSPDEAHRVEAHVGQCAACAADLRQRRRLSALLGGAGADIPDLRPIKLAQVHRTIDAEGNPVILRLVRRMTSVAAAVLVAGTVWLVSTSGSGTAAPVGVSSDAVTVADWELPALAPNAVAATEMATAGGDAQFAQFVVSDLSRGQ